MEINGKYNYNLTAKRLRASAFPKTEEDFIEYVRARERLFLLKSSIIRSQLTKATMASATVPCDIILHYALYVSNAYIQI